MQVALIAPLKNLELTEKGQMHMILAHVALTSKTYREFYAKETKHKILDNGAFEGEGRTIADVVKAAEMVGANEIILPDTLCVGEETRQKTDEALEWLKQNNMIDKYKKMAVVQGSNADEWWSCFHYFNGHPDIQVIGLSKVSCPKAFNMSITNSRLFITQRMMADSAVKSEKQYHLLGGSKDLLREIKDQPSFVRSIDTSAPFGFGQKRMLLNKDLANEVVFDIEKPIHQYNKRYVECNVNLVMAVQQ